MKIEHWLLYTSDREHGGILILGIFNSYDEGSEFYYKTHDENDRYYRIPFIQQWDNENKLNIRVENE